MVGQSSELITLILISEYEIGYDLWKDLVDGEEDAVQFIAEEFIESNMLFSMDVTQKINGEDALIGFNDFYDGYFTINFNTYFSEN